MFFGDIIIKEHPLVSLVHEKGINNETEQGPLMRSVLFSVLGGWFTRQGVYGVVGGEGAEGRQGCASGFCTVPFSQPFSSDPEP